MEFKLHPLPALWKDNFCHAIRLGGTNAKKAGLCTIFVDLNVSSSRYTVGDVLRSSTCTSTFCARIDHNSENRVVWKSRNILCDWMHDVKRHNCSNVRVGPVFVINNGYMQELLFVAFFIIDFRWIIRQVYFFLFQIVCKLSIFFIGILVLQRRHELSVEFLPSKLLDELLCGVVGRKTPILMVDNKPTITGRILLSMVVLRIVSEYETGST